MKIIPCLLFLCLACSSVKLTKSSGFDARLSAYQYPYEAKFFPFVEQRQNLEMAYMDVYPEGKEKGTVVLFHGKNFSGYYFDEVIKKMLARGYRVIVPDQIGFGKSSRPIHYQYSVQGLALNTKRLLDELGISKFQLWGHSMGGMIATRYALMFPESIEKLVLINPIGLEDWKTLVPYRGLSDLYQDELASSPDKIRAYQQQVYFDGRWKPEYERLIEVPIGQLKSSEFPNLAWISALTTEMIFTQPVYYEFKHLSVPLYLILGQRDRTAIGRNWAPDDIRSKLGHYPNLGKTVSKMVRGSSLIPLEGLGHIPFIESPERFWEVAYPLIP